MYQHHLTEHGKNIYMEQNTCSFVLGPTVHPVSPLYHSYLARVYGIETPDDFDAIQTLKI
jgi:hypothetical protein